MSTPIRIGIIGCGRAAELIYLPLFLKHTGIKVTAAVDPVKERRELISAKIDNCITAESINEVFQLIDGAVITTPPDTHVLLANSLLKCNKHVLVEKPLSNRLDDLNSLTETISRSNAHLMMAFNHRYWEPVINLKSKIRKINIVSAEISFTGNYAGWNPISFRSDSLDDLGPHVFDLIRYLFEQEIYSVSVISLNEQAYQVDLKTSGGINIKAYIAHSEKTEKTIKVFTDKNFLLIRLGSIRLFPDEGFTRKLFDINDTIIRKLSHKTSPIKRTYEIQFEKFISLIRSGKPEIPDIVDGIAAVRTVAAARLSLIRNMEIYLDDIK